MIEKNGGNDEFTKDNWNIPYRDGEKKNYFERLIDNLKSENPELVNKAKKESSLREILTANQKHVLALPINVETSHLGGVLKGRHWTVIHLNFKNNTIFYLDSIKPNCQAEKVRERLDQTLEWINKSDGKPIWKLNEHENDSPSVLATCQSQWDFFNCGIFVLLFTALVGEKKSYEEINNFPFSTMYRLIEEKRLDVIKVINEINSEL